MSFTKLKLQAPSESLKDFSRDDPQSTFPLQRSHSGLFKLLILLTFAGATVAANAQARPTATRRAEAQVGGSFINGQSDYSRSRFNGYGVYADLDFRNGLGAEAEFHLISDGDPNTHVYERTYEVGARYSRVYGKFRPYAKLMVGRGVFNYPFNVSNLAYNLGAAGAGSDIRLKYHINARIDYEYQRWFNFSQNGDPTLGNNSISPNLLSVGIAYRF